MSGLNLKPYPKCLLRLKQARAKFSDPALTPYWCAVAVAAPLDDELLTAFGGFDFDNPSHANGYRLLARLEEFFTVRDKLFGRLLHHSRKGA